LNDKSVTNGSHIWLLSSRLEWIRELNSSNLIKCSQDRNIPLTKIGSRIVTMHGDLHDGNVIKMNNNTLCVDLEFSTIGYAA